MCRVDRHSAERASDVGMVRSGGYMLGSQLLQEGRELHGFHCKLAIMDGGEYGSSRKPVQGWREV